VIKKEFVLDNSAIQFGNNNYISACLIGKMLHCNADNKNVGSPIADGVATKVARTFWNSQTYRISRPFCAPAPKEIRSPCRVINSGKGQLPFPAFVMCHFSLDHPSLPSYNSIV